MGAAVWHNLSAIKSISLGESGGARSHPVWGAGYLHGRNRRRDAEVDAGKESGQTNGEEEARRVQAVDHDHADGRWQDRFQVAHRIRRIPFDRRHWAVARIISSVRLL